MEGEDIARSKRLGWQFQNQPEARGLLLHLSHNSGTLN